MGTTEVVEWEIVQARVPQLGDLVFIDNEYPAGYVVGRFELGEMGIYLLVQHGDVHEVNLWTGKAETNVWRRKRSR